MDDYYISSIDKNETCRVEYNWHAFDTVYYYKSMNTIENEAVNTFIGAGSSTYGNLASWRTEWFRTRTEHSFNL